MTIDDGDHSEAVLGADVAERRAVVAPFLDPRGNATTPAPDAGTGVDMRLGTDD